MQSKKSSSVTRFCKVCFKEITLNGLRYFLGEDMCLCRKCYEDLSPKFIYYKVKGCSCLSLYFYDDKIRSLLYQFKGTLDIELKDIFIAYMKPLLKLYYPGYYLVPVPSSKEINEKRGFNQVEEMFAQLDIPMIKAIEKNKIHIQHEGNYKERKNVASVLKWVKGSKIKGKKLLLVDDVFTTGSTVRACIDTLKKHHPRKIKVLTMAKTREINDRDN